MREPARAAYCGKSLDGECDRVCTWIIHHAKNAVGGFGHHWMAAWLLQEAAIEPGFLRGMRGLSIAVRISRKQSPFFCCLSFAQQEAAHFPATGRPSP